MSHYFAEIDEAGAVVRSFVDLNREFPGNKFSTPETDEELAALPVKVVRVQRAGDVRYEWPMTIKGFTIQNIDGVYQEVYEFAEITHPELIDKVASYHANEQDPNVPIILTSEISQDATFF